MVPFSVTLIIIINLTKLHKVVYNSNKCVSRTDTNPPFAFQLFHGAQISQGFYREGQKATYTASKPLF